MKYCYAALLNFPITANAVSYCGLRKGNAKLSRYRMSEINVAIGQIKQTSIPRWYCNREKIRFTQQMPSAPDRTNPEGRICDYLIRRRAAPNDYKAFRQAGASRLLKHETASKISISLRPGCNRQNRLRLRCLKELGFETGTGNMVDCRNKLRIADDLMMMKRLDAGMLGIGPFIAHRRLLRDGTMAVLSSLCVFWPRTIAYPQHQHPRNHSTGRFHHRDGFCCRPANVVMPNFTRIYKPL